MFWIKNYKKKLNQNINRNDPKIIEGKEFLERTVKSSSFFRIEFDFIGTSKNGKYIRYHYQEKHGEKRIFIIISQSERHKLKRIFQNKEKYNNFEYQDTVVINNIVYHRFFDLHASEQFRHESLYYLDDNGNIY